MGDKLWLRLGGVAGIIYVVGSVVGQSIQPSSPNLNASVATIIARFAGHRHVIVTGEIIIVVAFIFAMWWLGSIRYALDQPAGGRDPLSWIAVAAGVATVTLALVGEIGNVLLAMLAGQPQGLSDPSLVRALYDMTYVCPTLVLFAAFVPALGIAAVRRGMVGSWLGCLAVAIGVVGTVAGAADLAVGSGSTWRIAFYVGLIGLALVILILSMQMLRGRGASAPAASLADR